MLGWEQRWGSPQRKEAAGLGFRFRIRTDVALASDNRDSRKPNASCHGGRNADETSKHGLLSRSPTEIALADEVTAQAKHSRCGVKHLDVDAGRLSASASGCCGDLARTNCSETIAHATEKPLVIQFN